MKFYSEQGYGRLDYYIKSHKRKWFGFWGYYLAKGKIYWNGNSYFVTVDITDLNWRDYREDKHWYQYRRHHKTLREAKKWCEFMIKTPPNYIIETWGNKNYLTQEAHMNSIEREVRAILEDTGTIDIDLALSQILKLTLLNEVKKLSFKEGDIILCKDIELNKQLARLKLPENFPKIPIVLVKDFNDVKLTNLPNELLPKVNNEYQCEHIKEKIIRSSCVWCNLTVAEKIIDRLKRELTNLRPLSEKEVIKFTCPTCKLRNCDYYSLGHPCHYEIAKVRQLCSHFSKPQIKYPEKMICSSPKYIPETRVSIAISLDAGDRSLEGSLYEKESYEECGGCPECIFNQAISDMRKLNGEGGV